MHLKSSLNISFIMLQTNIKCTYIFYVYLPSFRSVVASIKKNICFASSARECLESSNMFMWPYQSRVHLLTIMNQ